MNEPLWDFIQNREQNYDAAVHFVCVLRDVTLLADRKRGEKVMDAIRRAHYEEAINIALGNE
jgi:hypothetical protein